MRPISEVVALEVIEALETVAKKQGINEILIYCQLQKERLKNG